MLGGVDEEQLVGGVTGLRPFRNNPDIFSHVKAWALTGTGVYYGYEQHGEMGVYPAIIDTGTTLIAVPSSLFKEVQASWLKAVPDLDCTTDANFCQTKSKCDEIEKNLSPVGFLISGAQKAGDTVFEISSGQYLYQAPDKC